MRRRLKTREEQILSRAQLCVLFPLHIPRRVPYGMTLISFVHIPGITDYVCLSYVDRIGRGFRLSQRCATDASMADELSMSGDDHYLLSTKRRAYTVFTGMYLNEPIDGRYWAPTRRRVAWHDNGLRLEVEAVIARGMPVGLLARIADSIDATELTEVGPVHSHDRTAGFKCS
jgi:hypothetical protein